MFAKLLKHEFKNSARVLFPIALCVLVVTALGFFLNLLVTYIIPDEPPAMFLLQILLGLLWYGLRLALYLFPTASTLVLLIQFYRNKFTDQGYLTFTLPVSTLSILNSSLINYIFWSIIISTLSVVCFQITQLPQSIKEYQDYINLYQDTAIHGDYLFPQLATSDIIRIITYIVLLFTLLLSGQIALQILPHFAITVASSLVRKLKLLLALGIGFVIFIGTYFITIFVPITEAIIVAFFPSVDFYENIIFVPSMLILIVMYLALALIGYLLMYYLMHKKLNL